MNFKEIYERYGYPLPPKGEVGLVALRSSSPSDSNAFDVTYLGDLAVSVPPEVTEGDGVLVGQGTATVSVAPPFDLVVNLASSDPSEVTVPATVTIPAGTTSAPFDLTVEDDAELDWIQAVEITAAGAGYRGAAGTPA